MTKRELIQVNAELSDTLLALRAMIDEALAASGIDPDQDALEEDDDEEDESEDDHEEDAG